MRRSIRAVAATVALTAALAACGDDPGTSVATDDETPSTTDTTTTSSSSTTSTTAAPTWVCDRDELLAAAVDDGAVEADRVTVADEICVDGYARAIFESPEGDTAEGFFVAGELDGAWRLLDLGSDVDHDALGIPDDVLEQLLAG